MAGELGEDGLTDGGSGNTAREAGKLLGMRDPITREGKQMTGVRGHRAAGGEQAVGEPSSSLVGLVLQFILHNCDHSATQYTFAAEHD
ncbi:hypothetical protein Hypma_016220 [Hypsizygus marmoreus]|uniref:Uncharacterized protein n=1 Tax=Hypsizygus marmoreus TaxID=39966 RepID=A0A369J5C2_HYPMA|nr:hypothetical protein Hypma_016220 [Hypsizygus marmoreus]